MSGKKFKSRLIGVSLLFVASLVLASNALAAPPPETHGRDSSAADVGGPIAVSITFDRKTYATGDPIQVTMTVRNTTKAPVALDFSSGQKYDFELKRGTADGALVWRWSRGMAFTDMVSRTSLQPDKTLTYTVTLSGKGQSIQLTPGSYIMIGTLTTMPRTARPHGSATLTLK